MAILIVVNNPKDWHSEFPGCEVVSARSYLTDPQYGTRRGLKVFNLCRSYRYQSLGYYVSLLGTARGHKPLPGISTIMDMRVPIVVRLANEELEHLIQSSLATIHSKEFTLSIYFGRNLAKRHDRLANALFKLFPAPLLRAEFNKGVEGWELTDISVIPSSDVPDAHRPAIARFAKEYFGKSRTHSPRETTSRYDMAILFDPKERFAPSDEKAIDRFVRAGEKLGFDVEIIGKEDYGRLAEFDALFIRETTQVNHHTYRFARRAHAEELVVIDDPESILRCTNKVFLAELLTRHNIATPRTLILHRDNVDEVATKVGFPCILKQPDSAFSQGVMKVDSHDELIAESKRLMEKSELIIAQEFLPTSFDWRVGVLDRWPLFVCRYHMSGKHWQIVERDDKGEVNYGKVETVPLDECPPEVIQTALAAANLIGDGLYGVDLKQVNRKVYVIEINDNPNINAGYEDTILKDKLYTRVMEVFLKRIERRKEPKGGSGNP